MEVCEHAYFVVVHEERKCPFCELEKEKMDLEGRVERQKEDNDSLINQLQELEAEIETLKNQQNQN